jgi:outer membrane murein-binding lipoprotein Lpp
MAAANDLEARVTTLEVQVRELTGQVRHTAQDAAAARVLAGGADRDVTEIRAEIRDFRQATTASFNAMRADVTDLRADVTDLRTDFTDLRTEVNDLRTEMNAKFGEVDKGFAEMRGKFDAAAAGQQQIVGLLTTLIDREDGHAVGR